MFYSIGTSKFERKKKYLHRLVFESYSCHEKGKLFHLKISEYNTSLSLSSEILQRYLQTNDESPLTRIRPKFYRLTRGSFRFRFPTIKKIIRSLKLESLSESLNDSFYFR